MNDIWFVSDTHFGHANIIKYCNRPFASVEEMNETMIENWNKVVKPGDRVFHLGDFGFGSAPEMAAIFNRLRGQKHLIEGNHDDESLDKSLRWVWIKDTYNLKAGEHSYFLAHYAHRVWNKSFHGARHLFGHTHGMIKPWGWSCDAGVDCWDYSPVHIDTVEKLFAKLPRFVEEHSGSMPAGEIWQGRKCMLSFEKAFFGDGTYDNVDPADVAKKDPDEFKK
jgi:calcineurin-like phosphoesterase family protein